MKKILLTGASGLFGYNYSRYNKKFKLISTQNKKKISSKNKINLNLLNKTQLNKKILSIKPDIIIHAAALTNIEKCESNKKLTRKLNIEVTKNIIQCSKKLGCKLVFISTDHLFSKKKKYFKEKEKTNPLNYYAKSKKISEDLILNNLYNFIIIRTNFFGWGPDHRKSFSDTIIDNLKKNKNLELFDDVYFNPVNVTYLCYIINKLIQKDINGVFNVTSNKAISKYKFGLLLCKEFNLNRNLIKPIKLLDKKITKRPHFMSLSNKKLIKTLNISPNELIISKQIKDLKKIKNIRFKKL